MELDMTKGSPTKLIIKFMIPIIIGNIFQQFYTMVDTIIVGRFVGVQALAAVGATGTICFLILGFMQGLTTGFTVLISQRFGAGDVEGVKKSAANAAMLSVATTVIMTGVSLLAMDKLLEVMNTPLDIIDMSREYIIVICGGMGFNILYNILASILRAVGNSKIPLLFLAISAVLNIGLDLLLILVIPMGVAGAAWATIISQGISGVLCLIYIVRKVPLLALSKEHWKWDGQSVRHQLSVGIPMALQFSITAVGTILVQAALNLLGSTVVAAYTAAIKVEQLVTQPFAAMGMTMATYSAQNRGVNDLDRIKKGVKISNILSGAYGIVIYGVVYLIMPYIIRLFVSGDVSEVLEYAEIYIIICGIFFIPLGMIFIFRNVMQGCGFGFMPMLGGVVELVSRSVAAFIAASMMSYVGVCLANATAWLTAGVFTFIAYIFVMRKMERDKKNHESLSAINLSKISPATNQKGV